MNPIFEKLSPSKDRIARKIRCLDTRERVLKIYKLLAQARIAISRIALLANSAKMAKKGSSKPHSKAHKARLQREKRLKQRLEKAVRHVAICEGAIRVALVRRAYARSRIMESTDEIKT